VLQYGIIFIYIIPLVGIGLGVLVFSRIRIKKQKSYLGKRNNTQSTHLSKDSQNIETNPTSSSPENNRKCKVCGTNIPSESKNCPGCGDIYS
jgi:rubrerythrin